MSTDPRIGDAERDAAVVALGEHFAAGRLDAQEYDERTSAAWAARSAGALAPLFADLPAPHPRPTPATPAPRADASARRPRVAGIHVVALVVGLLLLTPIPWFVVAIAAWAWCVRAGHHGWHHGGPWHHRQRQDGRLGASAGVS